VGIDLGGIAKGYGVDRAVEALRAWGVTSALVNVGGDLYALGSSEDGDEWEVGIRSPEDPSRLKGVIRIEDRAVATSGDYERFFDYGDRRFHHRQIRARRAASPPPHDHGRGAHVPGGGRRGDRGVRCPARCGGPDDGGR
jgi:thiamine biosynthesis lipoprotein ApbE